MEGERRPKALLQVAPIEHACESILVPQETLVEGMPTALEARGTCQPKGKLPRRQLPSQGGLLRPEEQTRVTQWVSMFDCPHSSLSHNWWPKNVINLTVPPTTINTYLFMGPLLSRGSSQACHHICSLQCQSHIVMRASQSHVSLCFLLHTINSIQKLMNYGKS
jgi:hypothetical protein